MSEGHTIIFGSPQANVQYKERRAAYVVIVNDKGEVATVGSRHKRFLPGGGSAPFEAAEETIVREVREELALDVRLTRKIGEAVQYFYSGSDECHYKMLATFYAGEFTGETCAGACENELHWLPPEYAQRECFHECHAWAVQQS
jgi:8-oxo-dGTP diphosphatase